MNKAKRIVRRFRKWVFATPTSNIELGSALSALAFSGMFLLSGDILVKDDGHSGFTLADDTRIWLAILVTSIVQLINLIGGELWNKRLSVWLLKCSAFQWSIASVLYGFSTILTPSFFTYAIIAFMSLLAAFEIDERNMDRELVLHNRDN